MNWITLIIITLLVVPLSIENSVHFEILVELEPVVGTGYSPKNVAQMMKHEFDDAVELAVPFEFVVTKLGYRSDVFA